MPNQKFLLLNTSNMEAFPVYPYAFIQVPAIARQWGIGVIYKGDKKLHQKVQKWLAT